MEAVTSAAASASAGISSASVAVAAHPIDAKASANVARRDEVWRRRNWLRLACTRNQNCIAVADAAASKLATAVVAPSSGHASIKGAISGTNSMPTTIRTTSTLARITLQTGKGTVATNSEAS